MIPVDVRHASRRLAATPLLSLGAMLTLALGIGSAVVMVDVLDRLLLRAPAHVTDPDRVARVVFRRRERIRRRPHRLPDLRVHFGHARHARGERRCYFNESLTLGRGEHARRLEVVDQTPGYFAVLGVQPAIGSFPDAAKAPREDVAVISHALWQQEFGGSPDVLGKPIQLGLDTYTIIAVAPRGFAGVGFRAGRCLAAPRATRTSDLRVAVEFDAVLPAHGRAHAAGRDPRSCERAGDGHLSRDAPPERVGEATTVVFGDLRAARAPGSRVGTRIEVLVAAMSILVLLITCGNVANLLLVRGLRRDRELIVKTALGASRVKLFREVLAEATLLAAGRLASS